MKAALLLLDIGNTHTHLGLADRQAVRKRRDIPTAAWGAGCSFRTGSGSMKPVAQPSAAASSSGVSPPGPSPSETLGKLAGGTPALRGSWKDASAIAQVRAFLGNSVIEAVAACSVVPAVTTVARRVITATWPGPWFELTARTAKTALRIRYPRPETIGPDRLANAIAASHHHGAPCLAIDFGTAVTFDVVDESGAFVGGIIAPGISLMAQYLHEKTALLPRIRLARTRSAIGRSTAQAMRIAAVYGFRGMVRELIGELKRELGSRRLPVVATGGYARWVAHDLPEITAVAPDLTLEGLRLAWKLNLESRGFDAHEPH